MNDGNKSEPSKARPSVSLREMRQATTEEGQGNIIQVQEQDQGEALSESVLFRCGRSVFKEIDFVFRHSTARSKQKLLESIIVPRLKVLSQEIRGEPPSQANIELPASAKSIPSVTQSVKASVPDKKSAAWKWLVAGFSILVLLSMIMLWQLSTNNSQLEKGLAAAKQQNESVRLQLQVIQDTLQQENALPSVNSPSPEVNGKVETTLAPEPLAASPILHPPPVAELSKKRPIFKPQKRERLHKHQSVPVTDAVDDIIELSADSGAPIQDKNDATSIEPAAKDPLPATMIEEHPAAEEVNEVPLESAELEVKGDLPFDSPQAVTEQNEPEKAGMAVLSPFATNGDFSEDAANGMAPLEGGEQTTESTADDMSDLVPLTDILTLDQPFPMDMETSTLLGN